jgi:outer membrane protein
VGANVRVCATPIRLAALSVRVAAGLASVFYVGTANADTLEEALGYAYQNNPQLNAQRALVRATDENVSQAVSGYRPRVSATINGGYQSLSTTTRLLPAPLNAPAIYFTQSGTNTPHGAGLTATQTLLNGYQTGNRTRQADSQVLAARETLRNAEQTILLNSATAYMNLLRESANLELQRRNVEVLVEQLRQTRDRFKAGDVTATDMSQSESRLAAGRSQVLTAEANYKISVSVYRQVIGIIPGRLAPAIPVDRYSPRSGDDATAAAISQHPAVTAAQFTVDAAEAAVKVAEGALYPSLTLQGNLQKNWEPSLSTIDTFSASVLGQFSVPIYQGGAEYSLIRQAKETVGQRRMELAVARDQTRQGAMQAWAQLEAAKLQIEAARIQVATTESALNGVRDEARVGQRTTLDVLNAQQELVNARVALVNSQRDRLVASYAVLASVGRLSPQVLNLRVSTYDTQVHYQQVRDAWTGVRTPDGR